MIPKRIHYCWFGPQPMSSLTLQCVASWKQHLSDYEIILWGETNTELHNPFVQQALRDKKWAFVSDYVRLKVLVEQGGIYLDTDMLVLKDFSNLLDQQCFVGLESDRYISCGVIGAQKQHPYLIQCLKHYDTVNVSKVINYKELIIPKIFTTVYKSRYKVETLVAKEQEDLLLLDVEAFYPYPNPDPNRKHGDKDYLNFITQNTYAVHLWAKSWTSLNEFQLINQKRFLRALYVMTTTGNRKKQKPIPYFRKIFSTLKNSFIKNYAK